MPSAAVDLVAHLPAPPAKANSGACQLFESQVLAYASGNAVNIIDVSPGFYLKALPRSNHNRKIIGMNICRRKPEVNIPKVP